MEMVSRYEGQGPQSSGLVWQRRLDAGENEFGDVERVKAVY